MTLELVELLGRSFLGGTALAAAGFFPLGCIRLMHALGFGGAEAVGVFGACAVGARVIQERSAHCEGLMHRTRTLRFCLHCDKK